VINERYERSVLRPSVLAISKAAEYLTLGKLVVVSSPPFLSGLRKGYS